MRIIREESFGIFEVVEALLCHWNFSFENITTKNKIDTHTILNK